MSIKKIFSILWCAFFIFCLDFFSKAYVHHHIPLMNVSSSFYPYGGVGLIQNWHGIDFSINHVINKGAAWGILSSFQQYLLYFRIFIIGAMLYYIIFSNKSSSKTMPLVLIISGAIGNVVDYFIYGHVVDMFHFYFRFWNYTFPVFNVADSSIFCGVFWLFVQSLIPKFKKEERSKFKTKQQSG